MLTICLLLAVCIMGFQADVSAQGDPSSTEEIIYRPDTLAQTNPDESGLTPNTQTDSQQQISSGAITDPQQQTSILVTPGSSGKSEALGGDSWNLTLVNPWNPLPEDYTFSLTELRNGLSVDTRCYPDLQAMMDACRAEGLSPVICSAYRTQEYQEGLFQNKVSRLIAQGYSEADAVVEAGKSVAVPGTSEHQLGLAVDIVDINNQHLDESQESTAVQKWLMEHSWEYGFILRYPNDKSEITGIIYEPWHYRYVGREDARQIHDQGVCLEEYLGAVSQ